MSKYKNPHAAQAGIDRKAGRPNSALIRMAVDIAQPHVNPDVVNLEGGLNVNPQLIIDENQILKDSLRLNNVALQKQFARLSEWHREVLKDLLTKLRLSEGSREKSLVLMDETNSLRNELLTTRNKNKDLQKTVEQLRVALNSARNSSIPIHMPVHPNLTVPNEVEQERAKIRTLEQRLVDTETKATAKHEELVTVIGVINRKLEACERSKASVEKDLGKVTHQKRELERKLLSLQGPETPLICSSTEWTIDANLWAATNDFMQASGPMLTLCAGETVDSLTFQLQIEKKNLKRAKDLLVQHQDQVTNVMSVINKPCPCRTGSGAVESNEVGETIETLFQKIHSLQESLSTKEFELNQLKTKKSLVDVDSDKLGILKSQVLVYRSDYLAERKSRETITLERDRLMAELQILKEENKHLAAQVNSQGGTLILQPGLSRLNIANREPLTPPPHLSISATPSSEMDSSAEPILVCPNPDCKRKFDSLEPLQYHVQQCLQLSD